MPNTKYSERCEDYGFVTIRGQKDEFHYVLAHSDMSVEDNRRMHRFLFWARVMAENCIFYLIWQPLRKLANLSQSQVLLSLDRWIDTQSSNVARALRACRDEMVAKLDASLVSRGIMFFYLQPGVDTLLNRWWSEEILPLVPPESVDFFRELFRYDQLVRPIAEDTRTKTKHIPNVCTIDGEDDTDTLDSVELAGERFYRLKAQEFSHDIPTLLRRMERGQSIDLEPAPCTKILYYRQGFVNFMDNHEFVIRFRGGTRDEHLATERPPRQPSEHATEPTPVRLVTL